MKWKLCALMFCFWCETVPAYESGNELYSHITSESLTLNAAAARYIYGTTSGWQLAELSYKVQPVFCLPENIANRQLFDVAKSYLANNPQARHQQAAKLVIEAIATAFPCKK